ncbi:3-keto-5-aminohexanoate cleavage protein [Streptomyces orinoci]|uniref:3-keto-5-aminohexanoate cleavage protein n=1 Tax=Streptomyces orinoci TaxID=67339 RepID=A0ABV3JQX3_STRON|nr:3-keto-5-aminohexanoate cleavage protein [Streptomyces orinoci]
MLQVCLNGPRTRADHDRLPVTPEELAAAARAAVAAGAEDVHLHPKDAQGRDSLAPGPVAAAVSAVRAAVPGVAVGVTTGAWAVPDPGERARLVRSWTVLPDHASVNWHEDGARLVAEVLLDRGIGVEAGIFSGTDAARRFLAWPRAHQVLRVLAEIQDPDPDTAPRAAEDLLQLLGIRPELPLLLHGEGAAAWAVLRMAVARGLHTRIGLEDALHLPDGAAAPDNAELVRTARCYAGSGT